MILNSIRGADLRMNDFEESSDIIRLVRRKFAALQRSNQNVNSEVNIGLAHSNHLLSVSGLRRIVTV